MKLSLASKYAILTLIRLAARGGGPATVRELATESPVPEPYLAKLVPALVRGGILASARGRGGGITLARPAEEISLAEIIRVTEGEASFRECPFMVDPCPGNPDCPLAQVWDPLRDEVADFFERTTIGSLAARLRGQS